MDVFETLGRGRNPPPIARRARGSIFYGEHFDGVTGLQRLQAQAESVVLKRIKTENDQALPKYRAVMSAKDPMKDYGIRSDGYVPVMNAEILDAVVRVCCDNGITPNGVVNEHEGRMDAYIFFNDAEIKVSGAGPGENYHPVATVTAGNGDDYGVGLRVFNSYTGASSFGVEPLMVRFVCSNGAFAGRIFRGASLRHTTNVHDLLHELPTMIEDTMKGADFLSKYIMPDAAERKVGIIDVEDILWGAELPKAAIDAIFQTPTDYAPEIATIGYSAKTIFDASTAYITYRDESMKLGATEKLMHGVEALLFDDVSAIVQRGKERREKYEESLKLAKERREGKKLVVFSGRPN